MTNSPLILAIDPGYDRLGWAIGQKKQTIQLQEFGCIQTTQENSIFERYQQLITELSVILTTYQPTQLAIETLFFSKNTATAMRVSETRGLITGLCLAHGLQIFEYHPNQIKLAVTGSGRADKKAMEKLVRLQLKVPTKKIIDDTLDAMGVLITHLVSYRPISD